MRRETDPDVDFRPMLSSRLPSGNDARLRQQSNGGRSSAPCEKELSWRGWQEVRRVLRTLEGLPDGVQSRTRA
jgi:hypothetical protein